MIEESGPISVILLAGGSGQRMQGSVRDKALVTLAGLPLFRHSFDAFQRSGVIDSFVIVNRDEVQKEAIAKALGALSSSIKWASGGKERQDSVLSGLSQVPGETQVVLIHDCARPCIQTEAIRQIAQLAATRGAACIAQPVTDTIKSVKPLETGYELSTLDRSTLWSMETPQAFNYTLILKAYQEVAASGKRITDDLSAIEGQGIPVSFVSNGGPNPKLTTPQDIPFIEMLLRRSIKQVEPILTSLGLEAS